MVKTEREKERENKSKTYSKMTKMSISAQK